MKPFALLCAAAFVLSAADLPKGDTLIQRYETEEGGKKAIDRSQNAVMTGTVEIVGRNISGSLRMYQQGEKSYLAFDLPGLGLVEAGFNGEVAWESNALQGARIKEGDELEAAKRESGIFMLGNWRDHYKSATTMGSEDINGKPAWQVDMQPKQGSVEHYFFDKVSGLIVRMKQTLSTPLGDIPLEVDLSDYRVIDGVRTPLMMTQSAMGQVMAMHIDKVTYNADIPPSRFELPPAVKALTAKAKP